MNLLAIDFGTKNIGLAWCDTEIGAVLPFGNIKNQKSEIKNQELSDIIKKERIEKIVIGLPLGLDSTENANTIRVRKFGEELERATGVKVEYYDERFSSQEADRSPGGVSRDERSAMIILESFLAKKK